MFSNVMQKRHTKITQHIVKGLTLSFSSLITLHTHILLSSFLSLFLSPSLSLFFFKLRVTERKENNAHVLTPSPPLSSSLPLSFAFSLCVGFGVVKEVRTTILQRKQWADLMSACCAISPTRPSASFRYLSLSLSLSLSLYYLRL